MAKGTFQDIIPPDKRSIRNIPIPKRDGASEPAPAERQSRKETRVEEEVRAPIREREPEETIEEEKPASSSEIPIRKKRRHPRARVWLGALLSLLILSFAFLWFRGSAEIEASAKSFSVPLNGSLSAEKNAEEGELSYASINAEESKSVELEAEGEKEVSIKAKGTIIIYNNFSKTPQNLIANTRFETPEGLIFRLERGVTVPGQKTVAGKLTPGSIEATVIADKAGAEYNIDLTDFTIPGFKGDPKFNDVYARSKTKMTGGALGKVAVVDPEELEEAKAELEQSLSSGAEEKIRGQIPKGFFMPKGAFQIEYESSEPVSEDGKAVLTVTSKIKGFVFNESEFASNAASSAGVEYDRSIPVEILGEELEVTSVSEESDTLEIALKGNLLWSYVIDEETLKGALKGKAKEEVTTILGTFPGIEKAKVTIRPFWRGTLPDDPKKITVRIEK